MAVGSNTVTFMRNEFKDRVVKAPCKEKKNRVSSAPKQNSYGNNETKSGSTSNFEEDEAGKEIRPISVGDLIFKTEKHSQWHNYREAILKSP